MQIAGMSAAFVDGQEQEKASPRLVKAAHEFEGQMMKELLQPMMAVQDDGDDASGSGGALGEFAAEALGQGLSQQGGFGIADRIVGELSHSGNASHAGKVTANQHGDTVMRSRK